MIPAIRFRPCCAWTALLLLLFGAGCNKQAGQSADSQEADTSASGAASSAPILTPPARVGATLFLAQAQFENRTTDDGKVKPVPGPARLLVYRKGDRRWSRQVIEDPDSNVFHKAAWFQPPKGAPGILTIGAVQAYLKLWRPDGDGWTAESLWNPTFGGKYDRLRDFEVGDVTGDGADDIVIATHDQGVVAVMVWRGEKYEPTEIHREPDTFVHEIELGDIDGDGDLEIFDTPSHPNKLDGSIQPGAIDMWMRQGDTWKQHRVEDLPTRHAKEILTITLPGERHAVLLASLEGEQIGSTQGGGDTTRIRLYRWNGKSFSSTDVAVLPGKLCRFLTYGDTDGDGKKEVVAFTKSSGIWKLEPGKGAADPWQKRLIATGSSGFEHAAYLHDFNGDGRDEIYVASDDQHELRCYWYDGTRYVYEVIDRLKDRTITWNVTAVQRD